MNALQWLALSGVRAIALFTCGSWLLVGSLSFGFDSRTEQLAWQALGVGREVPFPS
jgi:hypothetical protein